MSKGSVGKTPTGVGRQITLPRRTSDLGSSDLPTGNQGREDSNPSTTHGGRGVGGAGGNSAAARGEEGSDGEGEESGLEPP